MTSRIKIDVGRVKAEMGAKGLDVKAAAQKAEITYGSFERILKEGRCAAFVLGRIARILDVPVWELVVK